MESSKSPKVCSSCGSSELTWDQMHYETALVCTACGVVVNAKPAEKDEDAYQPNMLSFAPAIANACSDFRMDARQGDAVLNPNAACLNACIKGSGGSKMTQRGADLIKNEALSQFRTLKDTDFKMQKLIRECCTSLDCPNLENQAWDLYLLACQKRDAGNNKKGCYKKVNLAAASIFLTLRDLDKRFSTKAIGEIFKLSPVKLNRTSVWLRARLSEGSLHQRTRMSRDILESCSQDAVIQSQRDSAGAPTATKSQKAGPSSPPEDKVPIARGNSPVYEYIQTKFLKNGGFSENLINSALKVDRFVYDKTVIHGKTSPENIARACLYIAMCAEQYLSGKKVPSLRDFGGILVKVYGEHNASDGLYGVVAKIKTAFAKAAPLLPWANAAQLKKEPKTIFRYIEDVCDHYSALAMDVYVPPSSRKRPRADEMTALTSNEGLGEGRKRVRMNLESEELDDEDLSETELAEYIRSESELKDLVSFLKNAPSTSTG